MENTNVSQPGITRRGALKGAATVAAGLTIGSLFAGLTGCAPKEGDEGGTPLSTTETQMGGHNLVVHESDVVIVGGGIAGCTAARRAVSTGKTVNIIDKGRFGHSGASGQNWGHLTLGPDIAADGGEGCFKNVVADFFGLVDQDWAWNFLQACREGQMLMSTEKAGLVSQRNPDGTISGVWDPEAPVSFLNGSKNRRFAQWVRRLGVEVNEFTMMLDILQDDEGRCGGIVALDLRTGVFHLFRSKATILATGQTGWVMKPTTMSREDTGDTHAILARRGLKLLDMELITFDYACAAPFTMSGKVPEHGGIFTMNSNVWDAAQNSKGEVYGEPYFTSDAHKNNPGAGFAMFELLTMQQVNKGEDIYIDTTHEYRERPDFNYGMYHGYRDETPHSVGYEYKDSEYCNQAAIVSCGHVEQNADTMQTEIPGLYTAITGLTYYAHTQAFGQAWIAGGAAAEAADELDIPEVNMDDVNAVIDHCLELLEREETDGALRATVVLENIRDASWNLQYPRNEEGCQAAIDEYARIRADELPKMYCADKSRTMNNEWKSAIEAENVLMCGEAIARASSMRKETRPWFYRSDYPKIDNENWFKHITCAYDGDGNWTLDTSEVVASRIPAEEVIAGLMDIDLEKEFGE